MIYQMVGKLDSQLRTAPHKREYIGNKYIREYGYPKRSKSLPHNHWTETDDTEQIAFFLVTYRLDTADVATASRKFALRNRGINPLLGLSSSKILSICLCLYLHIRILTCQYIYIQIYIHAYIYILIYLYLESANIQMHISIYVYKYIYIHIILSLYFSIVHTYRSIYLYIYIHICFCIQIDPNKNCRVTEPCHFINLIPASIW